MIRIATVDDAESLLEIYSYYVKNTAITFEYEVPSIDEFKNRIQQTISRYPYLVYEQNGIIIGYAYASPFKGRRAYDWAVETTIYVEKSEQKKNIGRELYFALENILKLQHIINLNACIAFPAIEDKYLTKNSVQFHEHLGYRIVGEFYKCGYKFGKWYNMVWMEKCILKHTDNPLEICPFSSIREMLANEYGIL